jgi:hypothetical protein
MSDELDEELARQRIEQTAPRLTGGLAGSGPLRDHEIDHLIDLWAEQQRTVPRESHATFVTRVYRAAAMRAVSRAQAQRVEQNRRLAQRLAEPGAVPALAEVVRYCREHGGAHLDVAGPRAAQVATELDEAVRLLRRLTVACYDHDNRGGDFAQVMAIVAESYGVLTGRLDGVGEIEP